MGFIGLKLKEGDPIYIKFDQLFSIQRVRDGIIGGQTKLWRLV
jgi:hypothetical protein